ncbi:C40 family peptidase [Paenibacillus mendelii]|uniref:C40 family peptidase n=1 Tax=Paenibacillus mendelii TaxID=206163 RepID=A0ABV6JGQ0_9BACL|nr:C40 family peptidase [Paenibacillus mendelii]
MTNMKRIGKLIAGVTISLSVILSGNIILAPQFAKAAAASSNTVANSILTDGQQFLGVPYHFGAKSGQTDRFDCSSFTQYIYKLNGIDIPRSSKEQSTIGTYVSKDELKPGDLVFFYSPIHHVGIYMGNGKVIHTYGKPGVTITDMDTGWWSDHYTTARRVIPNNGQAVTESADKQSAAKSGKAPSNSAQDNQADSADDLDD